MNLYTFFTPTHSTLFHDYFKKSLSVDPGVKLIAKEFEQECPTGEYHAEGWSKTMRKKVQLIITGIEETWGDCFIHADCDVIFLQRFKEKLIEELVDADIALQNDLTVCCAGFFVARSNDKTLKLFKTVLENLDAFEDDQVALNYYLPTVTARVLSHEFYSIGLATGGRPYPGPYSDADLLHHIGEVNIRAFHANYTKGVENKIKLLNLIKERQNSLNHA
tara:strand:+ start:367 stop:1026 length:660 start_codon:yes stop_codon:yes gene_type:complete